MAIKNTDLETFLNQILTPELFEDYGPNGLQIEGQDHIKKIAFSVSATKASIDNCLAENAQALIVHHGLFWKFHGVRTLTGPFAKRVFPLVKNEINLYGYHLPLDAHPEIGNAAIIAKKLEMINFEKFGDHKGSPTGIMGNFSTPQKVIEFKAKLESILNHNIMLASFNEEALINSIGIITGGANSGWQAAKGAGLDAYLTGEMSEHDWHESQEAGIHMFAGGHNATEQFGIQALMNKVQEKFQVECLFIPSDNPA